MPDAVKLFSEIDTIPRTGTTVRKSIKNNGKKDMIQITIHNRSIGQGRGSRTSKWQSGPK